MCIPCKKVEVRNVHQEGPEEILIANRAFDTYETLVTKIYRYTSATWCKIVESKNVDRTSHNHLKGLQCSNDHGQDIRNLHQAASSDAIVSVHEGMYCIVHNHEPSTCWCKPHIGVPREPQDSHMVVPVKKDELLLSQHNEDCINQLW